MQLPGTEWHKPRHLSVPLAKQTPSTALWKTAQVFPSWEHRGQQLALKLWCNCQHPCGSFPRCKQPQQLYFYGLPKSDEKETTKSGYTHGCLHTFTYLYMSLYLCAPICLHPNGAEDNRDTCAISPRWTRIVAAVSQTYKRWWQNNGPTHAEAAEMRRLPGPDAEAKPRATRLRVFYCSSTPDQWATL